MSFSLILLRLPITHAKVIVMMSRKISPLAMLLLACIMPTAIAQTQLPPGWPSPGLAQPARPNAPGAPNAPARPPGPPWIEPSAFTGAAIEQAILTAYRVGGRVYLPGGNYLVADTIDLTHLGPVLIEGEAMATLDGWRGRGGVILRWTGQPGGTMFKLNGFGVQFKNLMLQGDHSAAIGINLLTPTGWGSAMDYFESVYFTGFKTAAFQAAASAGEPNSADAFFNRCIFNDSECGFKVINDQGLNFHFDGCQFQELATAIQADRGGAIYIRGGGGGYCDTFLRTGSGGHNTGPITVRDFRFEMAGHTRRWAQLLDAPDSPGGTQVIFDAVRMASGTLTHPDRDTPTLSIGGNVLVVVRDSMLKPAGDWPFARVAGSPQFKAALRIYDSDIWADLNDPHMLVRNAQSEIQVSPPLLTPPTARPAREK